MTYDTITFTLSTTTDPYGTDKMAVEFLKQYIDHALSVGQYVCKQWLKLFSHSDLTFFFP
jgi:hypothetical protein